MDAFVKDEEIRDLDVTINTLSDELETLEVSVGCCVSRCWSVSRCSLSVHQTKSVHLCLLHFILLYNMMNMTVELTVCRSVCALRSQNYGFTLFLS